MCLWVQEKKVISAVKKRQHNNSEHEEGTQEETFNYVIEDGELLKNGVRKQKEEDLEDVE